MTIRYLGETEWHALMDGYTQEVWAWDRDYERKCDGRPLLIQPDTDLTGMVHAWNMVHQGYYTLPGENWAFEKTKDHTQEDTERPAFYFVNPV